MMIEQFDTLTDDEISVLWYAINKLAPPVLDEVEIGPELFTSVKHDALLNRIEMIKPLLKEEHKHLYESLKLKLTAVKKEIEIENI
jgi:hypothetical protein